VATRFGGCHRHSPLVSKLSICAMAKMGKNFLAIVRRFPRHFHHFRRKKFLFGECRIDPATILQAFKLSRL
jgi:hypothetical protein